MKSPRLLCAAASFALLAGLAGCNQNPAPAPQASEMAAPAPEAKPGLALSDGRLMLPVVSGRPAAAYFTLTNSTEKPVALAGVYIEGASRAEMHETKGGSMSPVKTLDVPAGGRIAFEQGALHVMVFDLDPQLSAGDRAEMTLTFADGDKLSAPLTVQAMASADDGMGDMDMGN